MSVFSFVSIGAHSWLNCVDTDKVKQANEAQVSGGARAVKAMSRRRLGAP